MLSPEELADAFRRARATSFKRTYRARIDPDDPRWAGGPPYRTVLKVSREAIIERIERTQRELAQAQRDLADYDKRDSEAQ